MSKIESRDYVAEMKFIKSVMCGRSDLRVGYVPYGHILHLWNKVSSPLCGSKAGKRNRTRSIAWGDGICRQCFRILQKREEKKSDKKVYKRRKER